HIKEPDGGADLLHMTVPQDAALEITAFCDERGYETYTTVDAITYMRSRWEDRIDPARLPKDMRIAKTHREHVTGPVSGIVIFSEEAVRLITDTFGEPYDGVLAFPVGRSESMQPYVTVTAAGADKGNALQLVCQRLGVPADEVIAMGDAAPDIAMFELAKIGVAMGNAPDDVKARADAVAPSNADAGVAWALRRFVLEA
ncbi:MAG: HAD hydrolase family protein, partial [Dehalococcoidia bacterium]|nr:HAD hydrolase family protein [Dehalococcoidia bacterium]